MVEQQTEIWKKIPNFEKYEVNNSGNIKNVETGKIKNARMDNNGYLRVNLWNNEHKRRTIHVHKLVTECFLKKPDNICKRIVVNHKDGNVTNNNRNNLEYVTDKENIEHKNNVLLKRGKYGIPRGIYWSNAINRWITEIHICGKRYYFGCYKEKSDAYKAVFENFKEIEGYQPWDENKYRTFLKDGESVSEYDFDKERMKRIETYA